MKLLGSDENCRNRTKCCVMAPRGGRCTCSGDWTMPYHSDKTPLAACIFGAQSSIRDRNISRVLSSLKSGVVFVLAGKKTSCGDSQCPLWLRFRTLVVRLHFLRIADATVGKPLRSQRQITSCSGQPSPPVDQSPSASSAHSGGRVSGLAIGPLCNIERRVVIDDDIRRPASTRVQDR